MCLKEPSSPIACHVIAIKNSCCSCVGWIENSLHILDFHLILDNCGTHKHPHVTQRLAKRPRFHLHFIPTSSSWLNLIERWFAKLTERSTTTILSPSFGPLQFNHGKNQSL
jgi:hypothetical protein